MNLKSLKITETLTIKIAAERPSIMSVIIKIKENEDENEVFEQAKELSRKLWSNCTNPYSLTIQDDRNNNLFTFQPKVM